MDEDLLTTRDEALAQRDWYRAENARLRGVIEAHAKWLESESSTWQEEMRRDVADYYKLKAWRLRGALHPANALAQPVQGGEV
jgi:hypothetical protein